jgi:murein DD-endopeptidase MepM/ murein hydrolase activator NlpD
MRRSLFLVSLLALVPAAPAAAEMGSANVAALQVALAERGLYAGPIDGLAGRRTKAGVRVLQKRAEIAVDGVAGRHTRAALGRLGAPILGRRVIKFGMSGWDVAALQFLLAWHGFPFGDFDGVVGSRTEAAILGFQRWAGLPEDGQAGSLTIEALHAPPPTSPLALDWPLSRPVGDPFGPRGARFHTGIDIPAETGTLVRATASGRVLFAGWRDGGWGIEVTLAHSDGVQTLYGHLSRVLVWPGQYVSAGQLVGRVGATGHATGPHLHFEVRVRGAAVDPLGALGPR